MESRTPETPTTTILVRLRAKDGRRQALSDALKDLYDARIKEAKLIFASVHKDEFDSAQVIAFEVWGCDTPDFMLHLQSSDAFVDEGAKVESVLEHREITWLQSPPIWRGGSLLASRGETQ